MMNKKQIEKTIGKRKLFILERGNGLVSRWHVVEVLNYDSTRKGHRKWEVQTDAGEIRFVASGSLHESPILFPFGKPSEEKKRLIDRFRDSTNPAETAAIANQFNGLKPTQVDVAVT